MSWWKQINKSLPWLSDALLCAGGLVFGGVALYVGLADKETDMKLLLIGCFVLLLAGGFSVAVLRDIVRWLNELRRDLSPVTLPLPLNAARIRSRMQEMQAALSADGEWSGGTIQVEEKRAIWIDGVAMAVHLLKQNWCAAVSLPHGGLLLPSQLRRIAANATVKLPARFLSGALTSCIICCDKGGLSIYPGSCAPVLQGELIPGLLSEEDAAFSSWLAEYVENLADEEE